MTPQPSQRLAFAGFLDELAGGCRDNWEAMIIQHYFDERLEEIRRLVVKMCIDGKLDASQLADWAAELRR
jgi:hypothetical protein